MGISKTNAAWALDRLGISSELREYEVDPNDLAAESVALLGSSSIAGEAIFDPSPITLPLLPPGERSTASLADFRG